MPAILMKTLALSALLSLKSAARTHVGDPFYVFSKHLSPQPEQVCYPGDFNPNKAERYEVLREWLISRGAEVENTEAFEFTPDQFALRAKTEIKTGKQIAFIPLDCMMTANIIEQAQIVQALKSLGGDTYEDYYQALFVLEEMKNPESAWKPYFDILPIDTSNFPVLWNSEEFEWLRGTAVWQRTLNKRETFERVYNEIAREVFEFGEEHSLHEFLVARLLTDSRAFKIPADSPESEPSSAVVPWADTCNHDSDPPTRWSIISENGRKGW